MIEIAGGILLAVFILWLLNIVWNFLMFAMAAKSEADTKKWIKKNNSEQEALINYVKHEETRKKASKKIDCRSCKAVQELDQDSIFCDQCGQRL